jgi:hypothetical protein
VLRHVWFQQIDNISGFFFDKDNISGLSYAKHVFESEMVQQQTHLISHEKTTKEKLRDWFYT